MTALFITALSLGLLGSFHCIGMCGPLAFSLPLNNSSEVAKFTGSLLYNTGRIITYSMLGLLFGLAGKSFYLFGFQQWLSISVGVIILFFLLAPNKWTGNKFFTKYTHTVRAALGSLFTKKNYAALFAIGLLNGLLPCGLIYMAVAGAIATADAFKSSFFMASFGLGTLPVMWSVSFYGNYINAGIRKKIRKAYPVLIGLMACLLILRGMGLGIPYVSPANSGLITTMQNCLP